MDYEKKKPTADCIVARLVPSWGSIVSLLFKTTEPYEHYYDEHGEEVPYGAIESWTDVELPSEESEDERIREAIEGTIRVYGKTQGQWLGGYDMDTLVFHLREAFDALEEQKEQPASGSSEKPNNHKEWSEEDERKINRIYEILGHAADDKGFLASKRIIGDKEAIELQDFLIKSLCPQPHWKPSEEQMDALNEIINTLAASKHPHESDYLFNILNGLRKSLKKL